MWSVGALEGSVVADYTPKATRGRWKALNSVTGLGFSGSAALGGWIIDAYGYGPCFVITACFQALSVPLLLSLWNVVAMESEIADAAMVGKKVAVEESGKNALLLPRAGSRAGSLAELPISRTQSRSFSGHGQPVMMK